MKNSIGLMESILVIIFVIVIRNSDVCHLRTIEQISSFLLLLGYASTLKIFFLLFKVIIEKIGNACCCNLNYSLTFRIRETLQRWLVQIVILQVVKLPCQLPWLPYQIMYCNFLKSLMLCNHLFALNIVQYSISNSKVINFIKVNL